MKTTLINWYYFYDFILVLLKNCLYYDVLHEFSAQPRIVSNLLNNNQFQFNKQPKIPFLPAQYHFFFRMAVLSLAKEMACGSFPAIIRNNFAHFLCRMQNYFFCFHLKLFNIVKINAVFIHLRSVRLSTTFRYLIVNQSMLELSYRLQT